MCKFSLATLPCPSQDSPLPISLATFPLPISGHCDLECFCGHVSWVYNNWKLLRFLMVVHVLPSLNSSNSKFHSLCFAKQLSATLSLPLSSCFEFTYIVYCSFLLCYCIIFDLLNFIYLFTFIIIIIIYDTVMYRPWYIHNSSPCTLLLLNHPISLL